VPPASPPNSCGGCGRSGTTDECQGIFEELIAHDFSDARYFSVHRLTVDTYAMQHPDRYCVSAISLAAHLTGLCAAIEHRDPAAINRRVQHWLSTRPVLEKPPLTAARGALTIDDVDGGDPIRYAESVMRWARATWDAYAGLQPLARAWIQAAML
jgi:hypothetical protein